MQAIPVLKNPWLMLWDQSTGHVISQQPTGIKSNPWVVASALPHSYNHQTTIVSHNSLLVLHSYACHIWQPHALITSKTCLYPRVTEFIVSGQHPHLKIPPLLPSLYSQKSHENAGISECWCRFVLYFTLLNHGGKRILLLWLWQVNSQTCFQPSNLVEMVRKLLHLALTWTLWSSSPGLQFGGKHKIYKLSVYLVFTVKWGCPW